MTEFYNFPPEVLKTLIGEHLQNALFDVEHAELVAHKLEEKGVPMSETDRRLFVRVVADLKNLLASHGR